MNIFLRDRQQWVEQFVPEPFRGKSWETFPASDARKQRIRDRVKEYADALKHGILRPLLLYGDVGRGKTYLASLVWLSVAGHVADRAKLDEAIQAGTADNVVWINGKHIPEICHSYKKERNGFLVTPEHLLTAYLAVLDDLDKCPIGTWAGALYETINERICMRRLPTIITMNSTPRQFVAKYGEHGMPIFDRLRRNGGLMIRVD